MKKFEGNWNGTDDLDLYVDVKLLPVYPERYSVLQITQDLVSKMNETDPTPKRKQVNPVITEIKQANRRVVTREIRRELAKVDKASRLIKRAKSVEPNDHRKNRHEAKALCREYM